MLCCAWQGVTPARSDNPDSPDKGTAEIIIGKQRNGPIGPVRLTFVGQYTKFDNFAGAQSFYGE